MHAVTVLIAMVATLAIEPPSHAAPMSYLDNDVIRLGVDLGKGGTITYLAASGAASVNVVNSWDLGREVQQSYYAGPDNFGNPAPPWTNFPWNPIGAGDTYGNAATVLEHSNDGQIIYTKTAPLQWALNRVPCECLIEQWITLDSNSVQVRNRLTNNRSDHTKYDPRAQELPAVYSNGTFWRVFTYSGFAPYTNGPLTQIVGQGPNWAQFSATEHWTALVNDSGFGIGVFNPFVTHHTGGFAGTPNIGGPSDNSTGYVAPYITEILDWNIVYEYDYALVLGTLDQIRAFAVAHRPDGRPEYQFDRDRQHFSQFINATDNGWPISGALRVNVTQNDPYIIGPEQWWQASEMPRLYVTAAYHTSGTRAQIFWNAPGQDFSQERSLRFTAIPDGRFHTYTVDLASSPDYNGTITGIRFDPSDGNDPGGYVDITSITWKSPELIDAANYQGLWWNAPAGSESGWGINFAHQGSTIFATWFTYDTAGKAWWLVMNATQDVGGNTFAGTLYKTTGSGYDASIFTADTPVAVGAGTLTFTDMSHATFMANVNGLPQLTRAITPQVFGPLPTCTYSLAANQAGATNYQGLWWNSIESGWGINFAHQGNTIFATWFTFDVDRTPLWLVATLGHGTGETFSGKLYREKATPFGVVPFVADKPDYVGDATVTFANGNSATFAYTIPAGGPTRTKRLTRQPLGAGGTVCH